MKHAFLEFKWDCLQGMRENNVVLQHWKFSKRLTWDLFRRNRFSLEENFAAFTSSCETFLCVYSAKVYFCEVFVIKTDYGHIILIESCLAIHILIRLAFLIGINDQFDRYKTELKGSFIPPISSWICHRRKLILAKDSTIVLPQKPLSAKYTNFEVKLNCKTFFQQNVCLLKQGFLNKLNFWSVNLKLGSFTAWLLL